ncbi:hypothetical protein [Streptomyces sp. Rer75]|uniref:hypothetical protein n=1 Tax=unclassified Streptomyces TaxID=2593676 RepID=UPI0035A092D4
MKRQADPVAQALRLVTSRCPDALGAIEQLSLADATLREAAHLLTDHHAAWTGIGKWLPRRLLGADPARGGALLDGHRTVAEDGDPAPLAAAAEQVLALLGGPLREGYTERSRPPRP